MSSKIKEYLKKHLPPNSDVDREYEIICFILLGCAAFGFIHFLCKYCNRFSLLFYWSGDKKIVNSEMQMLPSFTLTKQMLLVNIYGTVLALVHSIDFYTSFFKQSRSIYLMKRLPDGGKTLRHMVMDVPLCWALCSICVTSVSQALAFLIWRFCTPAVCLPL